MKRARILYAGLFHETHSFVAGTTGWQDFEMACDEAVLAKRGDASPTDGFLETAAQLGWDVYPTLDARAMPSGVVEHAMFERFWQELERRARPALQQGMDGIFLVLHGAMVTTGEPDPEGELLHRLRQLPGAATLPIFGVLDLHANVSARMCRLANGLVAYRENPHTDAKATAQRAAHLLARCLATGCRPHMLWCRPPIVWAPTATGTAVDPMLSLRRFADGLEAEHPEVWACNVAAGFSFADTPDTGVSLSLIVDEPSAVLRRRAEDGARLAWDLRAQGEVKYPPVGDVVAAIAASGRAGPVLLVEPSDNIGAGAPGDGTGVLRALVQHDVQDGLVIINDPAAVQALQPIKLGERKRLPIGGRGWAGDAGPLELTVTLLSRSDGRFELEDAHSHLASMSGTHCDMGPTAVVRSGGVTILLTSRKTPPFDLGQWRSQGIDPGRFAVIGVKAAVAHRRAYDPIASASYYVDTPGPCTPDLRGLPWKHLRRPIWPLDPIDQPSIMIS